MTRQWLLFSLVLELISLFAVHSFVISGTSSSKVQRQHAATVRLHMSLKPAAIPLMDSGKALARSGELIIDITQEIEIYGGALSAAGAQIRNSGDSVAQAAASCRFKTGSELVSDELREGGTCLMEATSKLKAAIEEANADKNEKLAKSIESMVDPMATCSAALEAAGAGIMQRRSVADIGSQLVTCGKSLNELSIKVQQVAPDSSDAALAGQRMAYAAETMVKAGNSLLQPPQKDEQPKGKAWIKG